MSFFLCMYCHQSWKLPKSYLYVKKTLKFYCNNYHLISILPNIEKVLEKLLYSRITKFLNDNNSIYTLQFGFRHNYSINHVLINLTEDIRKNLDEGKVECSIFVDLQKAFDTVDHNILLVKLEHFGICGVANDCFKSYFFDRRQFVYTNGFNSNHAMPKPIRFLNSY